MTQIRVIVDFSPEVEKCMMIIKRTKNRRIIKKNLKKFCELMDFDYQKYKEALY